MVEVGRTEKRTLAPAIDDIPVIRITILLFELHFSIRSPISHKIKALSGDGLYDIAFGFDTGLNQFSKDDKVVYTIEGTGITASSFDVFSTPKGGTGVFTTASHVAGDSTRRHE